jgi:hypothetical protein
VDHESTGPALDQTLPEGVPGAGPVSSRPSSHQTDWHRATGRTSSEKGPSSRERSLGANPTAVQPFSLIDRTELRNAVLGAVVTIALSFTGFSPLFGGGTAGYLGREPPKRGARTGAISGGLATLPIVLILVLGFVLYLGRASIFGLPGGVELAIVLSVMFPLLFAWTVGLSAVGGYLGAYLARETRSGQSGAASPERG